MEYLSQEGYDKIKSELDELIQQRLPEAIQAISEARDKGDLSENFEYRAAKREQSRLLGRIKFLQNVLAHARVLQMDKKDVGSVRLLSMVELTNMGTGKKMTYTIVSPHEANIKESKISLKSPIGAALLNRKKGEVVEVHAPVGIIKLRIDDIS